MKIIQLREKQLMELCISLLEEYIEYLSLEEIKHTKSILEKFKNNNINIKLAEYELLPIVNKIWDIEIESGNYRVISWNKYSCQHPQSIVTFATLSKKDNIIHFCNMNKGIEYEINSKSILGAIDRDGATLIEDISRKSECTVAVIGNKSINSYNGATKFITPKRMVKERIIDYQSKHNELILDSEKIVKIRDIG